MRGSAGRYHIRMLRLNDETFVWERQMRAQLRQHLNRPRQFQGSFEEIQNELKALRDRLDILIPEIPNELVLEGEQADVSSGLGAKVITRSTSA
jgi:hypothetical protein